MATVNAQVQAVLQRLPDNCSIEDVRHELYMIEKVKRGLREVDQGKKHRAYRSQEAAQEMACKVISSLVSKPYFVTRASRPCLRR